VTSRSPCVLLQSSLFSNQLNSIFPVSLSSSSRAVVLTLFSQDIHARRSRLHDILLVLSSIHLLAEFYRISTSLYNRPPISFVTSFVSPPLDDKDLVKMSSYMYIVL